MSHKLSSSTLRKYLSDRRLLVVDVGARHGLAPRWKAIQSRVEAVGFEPDVDECERLLANSRMLPYPVHYFPVGLGSVDGAIGQLHICRQPGCSSLYLPNEVFGRAFPGWPDMQVTNTIDIPLARMDTVLAQLGCQPDAVKIDVQGWELEVLKGMGNLLPSTLVVDLEVEFVEQYLGQPVFRDVDAFMHAAGFALRGIRRTLWRYSVPRKWQRSARGGQLVHGDALYVNRSLGALAGSDPTLGLEPMLKGLLALSAYRQDDLIMWLLAEGRGALAEIPEVDRLAIGGELVQRAHSPLGRILDRYLATESNRTLRRLVDKIRHSGAGDWHDPEFY